MQSNASTSTNPDPVAAPVLVDVTRLIELRWTGRRPNGIDRVCLEYARRFAPIAQAVVQHRGVIRVLGEVASRRLFLLLAQESARARTKIAALLAGSLAAPQRPPAGALYLNVSHTDFDLPSHGAWVRRHALRAIYLIHDLIPILHPQYCRPHAVARHTGRVDAALQHGSGIIVGSEAVARDLRTYAAQRRSSGPPVVVSALAGATLGTAEPPRQGRDDVFLCVGTIETRKNHLLLLDVWHRLRDRLGPATPRLVIVGRWGAGSAAFRQALGRSGMAGDRIEVLDDCSDDALATLMAGARAMLMPSLAEGFGLPMAEALAMGVPVIASDLACFREVGHGIPCLLDPRDVAAWVARIIDLDPAAARRQRLIDAMHGYRAPTWADHFRRIDPWLGEIAACPTRRPGTVARSAVEPHAGHARRSLDLDL